jgi:hypothetical protein
MNNSYGFSGQVAGSHTGPFSDRQSGYAMQFDLGKRSGWLRGALGFEAFSPEFNLNDLGFISRVNQMTPLIEARLQKTRPWGPFQQIYFSTSGFRKWTFRHKWNEMTYRRVNLEKGLSIDFNSQLKNFWWIRGNIEHRFESMDDLDTRGGPLILTPAYSFISVNLRGDRRLPISPDLFYNWLFSKDKSFGHSLNMSVRVNPASNIEFSIGPIYSWNFIKAQWVTNVDDDKDGRHDHFIYGELKSQTLDLTTRLNITFTPTLSLQLYMQPFVAVGDYKNFKELTRPSSYEFTPYPKLNFSPDFSSRSLRGNMVLRWEYRPGSTLFVVWSQNRSASFDEPAFHPWESVRQSFADEGQNIFLMKLNYWLGI